jgi:hypothetical protein
MLTALPKRNRYGHNQNERPGSLLEWNQREANVVPVIETPMSELFYSWRSK